MADDYKTDYSRGKNVNTTQLGSFTDFGDGTPARQIALNKLNNFSPSKVSLNIELNEVVQ